MFSSQKVFVNWTVDGFGAGTLITRHAVLTVGHNICGAISINAMYPPMYPCLLSPNANDIDLIYQTRTIKMIFGSIDGSINNFGTLIRFADKAFLYDPDIQHRPNLVDCGIIWFNYRIQQTNTIGPICLPAYGDDGFNDEVTLVGWGSHSATRPDGTHVCNTDIHGPERQAKCDPNPQVCITHSPPPGTQELEWVYYDLGWSHHLMIQKYVYV